MEFALVLPLLALFLFGIVQFGLAYDAKQSINSSAREGARTAAIPTNTFADVDTAARNAYQGLATDGEVTIEVTNAATGYSASRVGSDPPTGNHADEPCGDFNSTVAAGTTVVVEATVDLVVTIPFYGAPTFSLEGRGEFRCELP